MCWNRVKKIMIKKTMNVCQNHMNAMHRHCPLAHKMEDKNECWLSVRTCDILPDGVVAGTQTLNGTTYDECVATECMSGYLLQSGKCVK